MVFISKSQVLKQSLAQHQWRGKHNLRRMGVKVAIKYLESNQDKDFRKNVHKVWLPQAYLLVLKCSTNTLCPLVAEKLSFYQKAP